MSTHRTRVRMVCRGVVQGVGFRPFVHRLASQNGLTGWVCNGPEGVVIEVEGRAASVEAFVESLPVSLPPLARLDEHTVESVAALGGTRFVVQESVEGPRERALVPPDVVLCADCRREMEDPYDRRYHYPFITCTNCGPRFSLVASLPYDRERTSMACFPLCPDCRREYEDPGDRRFHAEPVCCPECGPRLWLVESGVGSRESGFGPPGPPRRRQEVEGTETGGSEEALRLARQALADGKIVAVKALGGFQLACRADEEQVVAALRARKMRPGKPFAVMARDLASARRLVALGHEDEALLTSPASPVVLAPRLPGAWVAGGVAPGLDDLGVMLPTAPIHVELLRDERYDVLVMTSGNVSDEPICRGNREAVERLGDIADLFLLHDRDVVRRVDDSVVRSTSSGPAVVRRARGWVPGSMPLPERASTPVLALGPFLQTTACLSVGDEAFLSQHVGDLDGEPARAFLAEVAAGLEQFLQVEAESIVVDGHPDFPSTWLGEKLADERGARLIRVQHHLAHAAAVLAEHDAFPGPGEEATAIALDGTGWGPDGVAWGGEWLRLGGDLSWRRLAHLEPLPLVGGEAAVKEPWRVAVAALTLAGAGDLLERLPLGRSVGSARLSTVSRLAREGSWPLATGAGRLFEAAGALLGLAVRNDYEGEAAARLEALATGWTETLSPWPEVSLTGGAGLPVLPCGALLTAAARRLLDGEPPARVAAELHASFVRLAAELAGAVIPAGATVAIGGGCLVNRLLRDGLFRALRNAGYRPLLPALVPAGDGGVSYGQAVLAVAAQARGLSLSFARTGHEGS